jgi:hypothetical protein
MPRYDAARYDPPAPVAIVSLRIPSGNASIGDVPLLIDTGADVTLLPRSAVSRLGVTPQPGQQYELIGFDGTRSAADAVELDMLFQNKAFRGRYLLTDDDHGILGRDVLAALKVLFDGPAEEWSELKTPA